jgi:glycosyltransferase involved in cell wall biosynthesis
MSDINNIDVSVVIPTYNRPILARRAIASALAQSISDLEVIVVDDCSDLNHDVEKTITSLNDDRIRYKRHNSSMGPSAARNTGINLSRGKYIAFLDDDDLWLENKLQNQLDNIGNYKASLCSFFTQYGMISKRKCTEVGFRELLHDRNYAINSGLLVESELLNDIRFDEELRVGEDIDFVFKILKKDKISYLNMPEYFVNVGLHERITNEKTEDFAALERRLQFVFKNIDIYGKFWANYTIASLFLRNFNFEKNKSKKLLKTIKKCGFSAASYAIYKKILNRYMTV